MESLDKLLFVDTVLETKMSAQGMVTDTMTEIEETAEVTDQEIEGMLNIYLLLPTFSREDSGCASLALNTFVCQ